MMMQQAVKRQLRRSRDNGGGRAVAVDRRICFLTVSTAALAVLTASLSAQTADSLAIRFSGMTAITGYEQAVTDSLLMLLPGSARDRTGNVTLVLGRGSPRPPFSVDNAYVDVGASSRDEVLALGISGLTPVSLTKRPHRYGDRLLAAPNAGRRAACAALASAALSRRRVNGTVVVAFAVQSLYADTAGLRTVVNLQGPFTESRLVTVPSTFLETTVETVGLKDVDALKADIVKWIGGSQ